MKAPLIKSTMANIFDCLPADVLKHVLSKNMDRMDRISFNQAALKAFPAERLYKKFPADYAIKHHLRTMNKRHNELVQELNNILEMHDEDLMEKIEEGLAVFAKLMDLFQNPMAAPIFEHCPLHVRENTLQLLTDLADTTRYPDDITFFRMLSNVEITNLSKEAQKAKDFIDTIPQGRPVFMKWK